MAKTRAPLLRSGHGSTAEPKRTLATTPRMAAAMRAAKVAPGPAEWPSVFVP
jgi:hypothetical protein